MAIKLKGDWKKLEKVLDPKIMTPVIEKWVTKASQFNGIVGVKQIKDYIKSSKYRANRPLTIAIKNSSKPLIGVDDGAQLYNSITYEVDKMSVFVGVLKTDQFYNIAYFLHEGGVIEVTEKMRLMFRILWLASLGHISPSELTGRAAELFEEMPRDWKPLKMSTTAIVIPSRPFVKKAFRSKKFYEQLQKNWEKALEFAFREVVSGG